MGDSRSSGASRVGLGDSTARPRVSRGRVLVTLIALAVPIASTAWYAEMASAQGGSPALAPESVALASVGTAPGLTSAHGVGGTTTADLEAFAAEFNRQRVAHDLREIPLSHIRYDPCLEQRLFWIAEDPSTDVRSAWGHLGTVRSDGLPSVGCDGNLAGGTDNTGSTVAVKWWNSLPHRASLYKPPYRSSFADVCIFFAMTHGGVPDEPASVTRAAARWGIC